MRRFPSTAYTGSPLRAAPKESFLSLIMAAMVALQVICLVGAFFLGNRILASEAQASLTFRKTNERFSNVTSVLRYLLENVKADYSLQPIGQASTYEIKPKSEQEPDQKDLTFTKVSATKINLRRGPGDAFPAVMSISRGTSLVVDMKKDGWSRIYAPTGERLWALSTFLEPDSG